MSPYQDYPDKIDPANDDYKHPSKLDLQRRRDEIDKIQRTKRENGIDLAKANIVKRTNQILKTEKYIICDKSQKRKQESEIDKKAKEFANQYEKRTQNLVDGIINAEIEKQKNANKNIKENSTQPKVKVYKDKGNER